MTKQNKTKVLVIYCALFFALWAWVELFLFPKIDTAIANAAIKTLVWAVPAAILIYRFREGVFIPLTEMFTAKVNWLKYLPIFLFFTVYILAGAFLQKGNLTISAEFGLDDVITVLFVGITEELVFRGWLLNMTIRENKNWLPIGVNALLFLAVHFPVWIRNGVLISSFTDLSFLCVLLLSVVFSCTFIKSKNILVPIVLHMYWDLLMFLLF